MSSGSPGRYQSRLFNFLNRQSRRLTNQYNHTVRHLKVAAVWGVQILLYPVYLLAQAGLSAGRQLSSAAEAGWPQLKALRHSQPQDPSPTADTPIQQVLSEVNTLELQVATLNVGRLNLESLAQSPNIQPSISSYLQPVNPTQLSQTEQVRSEGYRIQGVASLLETQTLVLVTVENQILDILTPQQQRKLSSKISWELASLRRQWRIGQASRRQFTQRSLTTLDKPPLFLPVRLFWQLMAWVQTSPVAIAANLFQESTLVDRAAFSPNPSFSLRYIPQPKSLGSALNSQTQTNGQVPQFALSHAPIPRAIAFIDHTVAELESHQLVPGSTVIISLRERAQKLLQPLQSKFLTAEDQSSSPEVSQTHSFGIQALIYAAIEYFFGRQRSNLSQTDFQERSAISAHPQGQAQQLSGFHSTALLPNSEFADTTESDPWLTWSDLYSTPHTQRLTQNSHPLSKEGDQNPKSQRQLPAAFKGKMPMTPRNSIWTVIKRYLSRLRPSEKLSAPNPVETNIELSRSVVPTAILKTQSRQRGTTPTKRKNLSPVAASSPSKSISSAKEVSTAITTPSSPNTDLEPAPDWIETQATPTGYVKHPLEQLLQWLDLVMLWLEERFIKAWQWIRQKGRRG